VVTFWRIAAGSFWWSAGIGACVGLVSVVLVGAVWMGVSGGSAGRFVSPLRGSGIVGAGDQGLPPLARFGRRSAAWWGRRESAAETRASASMAVASANRLMAAATTILLIAGLMPGVLVGSATARAWDLPGLRWVGDSAAIVVIGHVARFGFVAVLAGWFLARAESGELRDMRMLEAGASLRGWALAALPPRAGIVLGAAVACGLLSFHEIEAAVMLQPPTSAGGGFAWKVLQALHFNREEDLIPAMLIVMGVGLGAALAAVGVFGIRPTWGPPASE
jgi:hypothetical protein